MEILFREEIERGGGEREIWIKVRRKKKELGAEKEGKIDIEVSLSLPIFLSFPISQFLSFYDRSRTREIVRKREREREKLRKRKRRIERWKEREKSTDRERQRERDR